MKNPTESNTIMLTALKEIAEAKGRYNEDRLEHASNTIQDMVEIAKNAINEVSMDEAKLGDPKDFDRPLGSTDRISLSAFRNELATTSQVFREEFEKLRQRKGKSTWVSRVISQIKFRLSC